MSTQALDAPGPVHESPRGRALPCDTVEDILLAAQAEFEALGYELASIKNIARRAQVTKQTVYYYFEGKEEIYRLVLDLVSSNTLWLTNSNYDTLEPVDALRSFMENVFRYYVEKPYLVQITLDEAQHKFKHVSKKNQLHKFVRMVIDGGVAKILERGVHEGVFRDDINPDELFWMIYVLILGWYSVEPMIAMISAPLSGDQGLQRWQAMAIETVVSGLQRPSHAASD